MTAHDHDSDLDRIKYDGTEHADSARPGGTIVYYVAQSLDGFIADEAGGIDWLLSFGFDEFQAHYDAFIAGVGAVIMGGETFRWLAAAGEPWPYPDMPCWVVSRSALPAFPGATYTATSAHPRDIAAAARNAAGARAVWMLGGGITAARFADAGALDELRITIMPVTLGRGAAVLPHGGTPRHWKVTGTTSFASGAVELRYRAVRAATPGVPTPDAPAAAAPGRVPSQPDA